MVLGGEADAPDVPLLVGPTLPLGVEVEPAEDEAVVHGVELGESVLVEAGEGVALGVVLQRPLRAGPAHGRELALLLLPQGVEAGVPLGDPTPLEVELGLADGHGIGHRGPRDAVRGGPRCGPPGGKVTTHATPTTVNGG